MTNEAAVADASSPPLRRSRAGLRWGLLGVAAFSFTVPFTRVAVLGGMSPLFVGAGRSVLAAVLAGVVLAVTRQAPPRGVQWLRIGVVAAGGVVGFPVLTSYALRTVSASHGAVVIAVMPAATAVVAVLRGRERPGWVFWVAAVAGAASAVAFAALQGGGFDGLGFADLLLFLAVVVCAIGYAEGGLVSRELGSWQTISWALVVACPVMAFLTVLAAGGRSPAGGVAAWGALAYLGMVSMFLGYIAWYRGLSIGPMTGVSHVQLLQPLMSVCWAWGLLGERVGWTTVLGGFAVIVFALLAMRSRGNAR